MRKPTSYDSKGHKICPECNLGKSSDEYYFVGHAQNHLSYFCKSCTRERTRRRSKKVFNIEVVDDAEGRFVITTLQSGEVIRKQVDLEAKPRRKPRRPYARAYSDKMNKTRKKRY